MTHDPWEKDHGRMPQYSFTVEEDLAAGLKKLARLRSASFSAAVRACLRFALPQLIEREMDQGKTP